MTVEDDGPIQGHIGELQKINVLGEQPEGHLVNLGGTQGDITVVMQPEDVAEIGEQMG